ncbi:hypothetical protein AVEN_255725-1, partial [Araneus ventricosus]
MPLLPETRRAGYTDSLPAKSTGTNVSVSKLLTSDSSVDSRGEVFLTSPKSVLISTQDAPKKKTVL